MASIEHKRHCRSAFTDDHFWRFASIFSFSSSSHSFLPEGLDSESILSVVYVVMTRGVGPDFDLMRAPPYLKIVTVFVCAGQDGCREMTLPR